MQAERDGVSPSEAEVEAVVALLLEMFDDASPEWAVSYVAWAKADPHRGDCSLAEHQGPITCDRCVWENYSAKARRLIAARPATPGGDAAGLAAELERLTQARFDDLRRLLRALGLSDHARPIPPAEVFDLCLRDIEGLRQRIPDAEADALRLHREKMDWFDRATAAERDRDRLRAENDRLRARPGDAPADAIPSHPEHDHHG